MCLVTATNSCIYHEMQETTKNRCTYFSQKVGIDVLEHLVETKLAKSLHGVAKEGRSPALSQFTYPRLLQGDSEAIDNAAIFTWIDLDAAFDQIQRDYCRMCYTTAKDTTEATQGIVLARTILTAGGFCICNNQLHILYQLPIINYT